MGTVFFGHSSARTYCYEGSSIIRNIYIDKKVFDRAPPVVLHMGISPSHIAEAHKFIRTRETPRTIVYTGTDEFGRALYLDPTTSEFSQEIGEAKEIYVFIIADGKVTGGDGPYVH
jgi:hypothetical protein